MEFGARKCPTRPLLVESGALPMPGMVKVAKNARTRFRAGDFGFDELDRAGLRIDIATNQSASRPPPSSNFS